MKDLDHHLAKSARVLAVDHQSHPIAVAGATGTLFVVHLREFAGIVDEVDGTRVERRTGTLTATNGHFVGRRAQVVVLVVDRHQLGGCVQVTGYFKCYRNAVACVHAMIDNYLDTRHNNSLDGIWHWRLWHVHCRLNFFCSRFCQA